jgi:hypothetical protein
MRRENYGVGQEDLFVLYLTILSIAQIIQQQMTSRLYNELKKPAAVP